MVQHVEAEDEIEPSVLEWERLGIDLRIVHARIRLLVMDKGAGSSKDLAFVVRGHEGECRLLAKQTHSAPTQARPDLEAV